MDANLPSLRRAMDTALGIIRGTGRGIDVVEFRDGSAMARIETRPSPLVLAAIGPRGVWSSPFATVRRGTGWAIVSAHGRFTWLWTREDADPVEVAAHATRLRDDIVVVGGSPGTANMRDLLGALGMRVITAPKDGAAIAAAEIARTDAPVAFLLERAGTIPLPVTRTPEAMGVFAAFVACLDG